jgi:hypothetical protein
MFVSDKKKNMIIFVYTFEQSVALEMVAGLAW